MDPTLIIQPKQSNLILAVFISFQLLLIILVAVSLPRLFFNDKIGEIEINRQPQIVVNDLLDDIPSLYTDNINHIQRALFNTVKQNHPEISTSLSSTIRSDSIKTHTFEQLNSGFFSAIFDIPEIHQSYQVYYGHTSITGNEAPNDFISILCAPDATNCKDLASQPSKYDIVSRYLKLFNFNYFSTFIKNDEPSKVYINPTKRDVSEAETNSYLQETKNTIESLGVSPDLFTYEIIKPSDLNYFIAPENR